MKTLEYLRKYELNINDKFKHNEFVVDLTNDFLALLELNKADNNMKGFENALRAIKMKWDAINNKTVGQLPETLWKFFFATVVVKLREELCPKEMNHRREVNEQKKKDWEARQRQNSWESSFFEDMFESRFNFLRNILQQSSIPKSSFINLDLNHETATLDDVQKAYRKLVIKHHPDKGGKQEDFISITESKNKCIQWLTK